MNRNLPHFFKVRLELARESEHPSGDAQTGYEFVAPLDEDGRIRPDLWKNHAEDCVARSFTPGAADRKGKLRQSQSGSWYFDYDSSRPGDDEYGYRLDEERFVIGEYISIGDEAGRMHTYRVTRVEKP